MTSDPEEEEEAEEAAGQIPPGHQFALSSSTCSISFGRDGAGGGDKSDCWAGPCLPGPQTPFTPLPPFTGYLHMLM